MPSTATRKRSPERQEMYVDIITTAVEGGINYWAQVGDYHWYDVSTDAGTAEHEDGVPNAYVTVYEQEPSTDEDLGGMQITVEKIASAWRKTIDEKLVGTYMLDRFKAFDRDPEEADLDAADADAIVQVACFGEVVYG